MYKESFKRKVQAAALGAVVALLLRYPEDAMNAVRSACRLWAQHVMPALFPYMVVSSLLISLVGGASLVVPLSMLGGSPGGARLLSLLPASPQRAQRLAALCTMASPLYILGTLSGGLRMLLSHWLGAFVAFGCVYALTRGAPSAPGVPPPDRPARPSFADIARDSALSCLYICGYMALFMALSALLSRALPLPGSLSVLLACVLEMAGGCAAILSLGLSSAQTMPLLCAAVSFGGLSIFMQNAIFLKPARVSMRTQLLARLIHAAAAYGLCALSFYLW